MADNEFKDWRFVRIGGVIEVPPGTCPEGNLADALTGSFLEWVESHGWYFGGAVREVDADGKKLEG